MTRLIDPSLEKLSSMMMEMGNTAIECISLAIDSYLEGKNTINEVHDLSDSIRIKYFEVEDLIFDMLLKYQPLADDFRLIRSSTEISYAFSRFGRYAYDITQVRDLFGDISECMNEPLIEITKKVKHMIKDAVQSFAELDIRKA
ncbi:MAG TPA: phosphate uptake regulator PhoU, partial [Nitrosopumilus sp.]|nr:phosphate uptake regulator PhoU [Nitrosopumilus sp.]